MFGINKLKKDNIILKDKYNDLWDKYKLLNKEIEVQKNEITDSINYDKRKQTAVLLSCEYTSKILGYKKQKFTSNEWDRIEQAFIDGYNKGKKTIN